MELVKNIFFNTDKLVENSNIKISYTGKFFQENSEEVFIHYGFGLNWDGLNEIKMEKTELGFQAEIFLGEGDLLISVLEMVIMNGIIIMVKIILLRLKRNKMSYWF